ncbi:chorismate-binding protein [Acetobacterium bakii]|uniref:Aminodeoxychorismate synthase n=1 Tax=Acetobacterium bakii TaxID=52689 RepID=A0A0L6U385_9FIRM|nr:chorismate-binding protein [Acetobacterium bakii]KNZ42968.1 hypothetical protein AKG39_04430 [Acetobacterium bakii]
MLIKKIDTNLDSFELFALFKKEPFVFFLDSGTNHQKLGRYSFIGWDPFVVFKSSHNNIKITQNAIYSEHIGDPLKKLKEILSLYHSEYQTEIPFIGGAVGYLGYNLWHQLEQPPWPLDNSDIPDCYFGLYDGIIIIDHLHDKVYISALGIKDTEENTVLEIEQKIKTTPKNKLTMPFSKNRRILNLKSNLKKGDYLKAVRKIKDGIQSGTICQDHIIQRFDCSFNENPFNLYEKLRKINPVPFSTYMDFGDGQILSNSPERFIHIENKLIDELEPTQHGVYASSIGYIGFNGGIDLNIAIETIICKDQKVSFQVESKIVFDSDPELEHEQALNKAKAFIRTIEAEA